MSGNFYICATPIGNIDDITIRAIETLKQADYIACEDTRVTKVLAEKYEISAKLLDCHKFNEKERSSKIVSFLKEGKNIVLVSDAGTPLISDPGAILIQELLNNNIKITSLPGACAVTTFLSMLPRNTEEFAFIGFIPRNSKQQIDILNKYKTTNCVFYESPLRLISTLENIASAFGENTKISIGRELTKVFEEVQTGNIIDIINHYKSHILKGEIVAMIFAHEIKSTDNSELIEKIKLLQSAGFSTKDISKILSVLFNEKKNKIFDLTLKHCTEYNF